MTDLCHDQLVCEDCNFLETLVDIRIYNAVWFSWKTMFTLEQIPLSYGLTCHCYYYFYILSLVSSSRVSY